MELERVELHRSVRREYKILLRIEAELLLPIREKGIREFYQNLSNRCLGWARDEYGARLLREYDAIEGTSQKARYRTQIYRFRMRLCYEDASLAAFLCESVILGRWAGPGEGYRRLSHVWQKKEGLLLPAEQIMSYFGVRIPKRRLPFQPDGIYPEGEDLILFRNVTECLPFEEKRLAIFQKSGTPITE